MNRLLSSVFVAATAVALPAMAQTPPAQPAKPPAATTPAPATKPATPAAPSTAAPTAPAAPGAPATPQAAGPVAAPPPVPLPSWFHDIDTANKGEVSRADFLKFRMKTFDQLDAKKAGKLSVDEFLKVAEPPFSTEGPNVPPLADRQKQARAEFDNLDTNRDGFIERAEAEAQVHAEFNQYDTDRDNKITEPELRLIVQRAMQQQAAQRQEAEARRRQGMMTINEFIDGQLIEADKLDKNGDGKISQQEYITFYAGPADGPQAQGLLPYDLRRKIAGMKFAEIDSNKDGTIDRVELTAYAMTRFIAMDANKDRFLSNDEARKDQEAETAKLRATVQTLMPAQQQQARPAPAQQRGPAPAPQPQAPQGLAPGLPQGTR